jgi:multidrug efflux system membrane fusion protein
MPYRVSFSCIIRATLIVLCTMSSSYAQRGDNRQIQPTPVSAATVQQRSMPVWIEAPGTAAPRNYVSVMPRVAGLLTEVNFKEGQQVKRGQLLATMDDKPYRVLLEQAKGQLIRDGATLAGAKDNLTRYETLLTQDSISAQQVTDQRALTAQLTGTVKADQAAVDTAQLQLGWTRITSPISGIAGMRQVDAGNMVGTSGAIGGGVSALSGTTATSTPIVSIAQVQPVTVLFAVPQNQLPAIQERMRHGASLQVQAWDQRRTALLDTGKVIAVDNQINAATGTVMIKAQFANAQLALFPNQFVNAKLLVNTLDSALTIPAAAIATGTPGSYVYVIDTNNKVKLRTVTVGVTDKDTTTITAGLKAGERVVTDGLDRLRDGASVLIVTPGGKSDGKSGEGHKPKDLKAGK